MSWRQLDDGSWLRHDGVLVCQLGPRDNSWVCRDVAGLYLYRASRAHRGPDLKRFIVLDNALRAVDEEIPGPFIFPEWSRVSDLAYERHDGVKVEKNPIYKRAWSCLGPTGETARQSEALKQTRGQVIRYISAEMAILTANAIWPLTGQGK
jgi:hypothetical protein